MQHFERRNRYVDRVLAREAAQAINAGVGVVEAAEGLEKYPHLPPVDTRGIARRTPRSVKAYYPKPGSKVMQGFVEACIADAEEDIARKAAATLVDREKRTLFQVQRGIFMQRMQVPMTLAYERYLRRVDGNVYQRAVDQLKKDGWDF